ncbi:MAG: hypothetical protein RMA76_08980 [Deltaproteobacteria bacterium]
MRARFLLLALVAACGSSGDDLGDGTTNPPDCDVFSSECMACASALESDSAACAIDPQACTAMQDIEMAIQCFEDEGVCQKAALGKAASCHRSCCDVEQANVETCVGDCFVTRSECAVVEVRRFDQCYMICNDPLSCAFCDADFDSAMNGCNADAQRCADVCVMTHRPS